ncbi:hypothetical protein [Citrobacter portucalensis]|uniref:hypothetical protein n=1 Tax=Citrobacter portucalensis TaxID=1639133 RepID=UPI00226B54BF|nr:hypothetical protein [Citrobacter portucalensis]MCX9021538.1 hypothetical protein [Citrobacter portucalensis]
MKAKRQSSRDDKLAFVRYSPLVETIIRNAVRSGTLAVISGVDLSELNRVINRHRDLCWRSGVQLHISHYTSSHDRGSLHPSNLGIWPAWLNFKQGKASLPIGHSISDRHWHDSGLFCSTPDEAWRILVRKYGKTLIELASRDPQSPDDRLRKPARQDTYKRLTKAGYKGKFFTVHTMSKDDFDLLCKRYGLPTLNRPEPDEKDIVSITSLLESELYRQRNLYPELESSIQPFLSSTANYPERVREEFLSLAVTHNYQEAKQVMRNYVPNKPIQVIARKRDGFASEVHTWRGDDNRWHNTTLPTNPANLYTAYSKQFGESFPF